MTPVKYFHTLNLEVRTRSVAALTTLGHLPRGAAQRARAETTHVHARSRRAGALTRYRAREWIYVLETAGRKGS